MKISYISAVALGLLALPAAAKAPDVVTDFQITGALVQEVMGDLGRVEVLLPAGADAHDYQLRPSQARSLQNAGLTVWVGPAFAPWMERAVHSAAQGGESLALLNVEGTFQLPIGDAAHEHEHEHDGHEHEHEHDHGPIDPHAWLAPQNAQLWLSVIAAELGRIDPDNAAAYSANAEAASARIETLGTDLQTTLEPLKGRNFVVQHDAYRYFTHAFGLNDAIAVTLSDASAPSAAALRKISDELADLQVICAFPEVNHDDRLLRAAIEGTDVRLGAPLDPEGSRVEAGSDLYARMLSALAQNLADCMKG